MNQNTTIAKIRISKNDVINGMQPIDQSKHSHNGFNRIQALSE